MRLLRGYAVNPKLTMSNKRIFDERILKTAYNNFIFTVFPIKIFTYWQIVLTTRN